MRGSRNTRSRRRSLLLLRLPSAKEKTLGDVEASLKGAADYIVVTSDRDASVELVQYDEEVQQAKVFPLSRLFSSLRARLLPRQQGKVSGPGVRQEVGKDRGGRVGGSGVGHASGKGRVDRRPNVQAVREDF